MCRDVSVIFLMATSAILISCSTSSERTDFVAQQVYQTLNLPAYTSPLVAKKTNPGAALQKVAFVCCNSNPTEPSSWENLSKTHPDLIVFAGNTVHSVRLDEKPLHRQYQKLDQNPAYRVLRETTPILATWDDLDYGLRFGDSNYPDRTESRNHFLNYWAPEKIQEQRNEKGVEDAVIVGPKGQRIQIIMLDVRFYASAWKEAPGKPQTFEKNWSPSASLLGGPQWQWLSKQLKKPAEFRIIVSPLQVGANTSAPNRWGLLPLQRQQLFDTIRNANAKNTIILSGNRNFGSFAKVDLKNFGPLYDMTVGPLNGPTSPPEEDFHYIGKPLQESNFGLLEMDWKKRKAVLRLVTEHNTEAQKLEVRLQ